jgi:predicted ATPase
VREEIRLGPLSTEAAAALCRALLWPVKEVPARAIERLVDLAQAIPLFLVELIRSLKRGGAVRRHARGDAYYLVADELDRLPGLPLVEWLAQRELASLPPDLAAHARLSSLLGPEHTAAEVAGVLRVLERKGEAAELRLDALVGVRQLVAAGILVLRRPSHLAFRHALVREAIARTVPPDLRVRWHRAAFTFHREARGAPDEGRLAQLAHHAAGAGLPDVARDTYLALAERARERHAYLDAGALYTSALAQPGEAASIFYQRALRGRGLVRCRIGRYDDALADLGRAREHAAGHGDAEGEAAIRLDEATIRDWMERSASR